MHVLGIGVDEVVDRWRDRATALAAGAPPHVPDHAPRGEYARTPAADAIARHAADEGLFHFSFEHRVRWPLPDAWVPEAHAELTDAPIWERGVLPEPKYAAFRHDLLVGSHHPHHRAKWAVHELCHGLVGFAWRPDATDLFHAHAARAAELLPVALWYFFDEAFLRRCPDHHGDGALFRTHCPRCEAIARADADPAPARQLVADGLRFVDRELAALARSMTAGRPIPHRWATIDLCSDGVAYAAAHGARLRSPLFAAYMERFGTPGPGGPPDLDALIERVVDVLREMCGVDDAAPRRVPSPAHGRWRWTAQDLAWRALQARSVHRDPAVVDEVVLPALDALVAASHDPDADPDAIGAHTLATLAEVVATAPAVRDVLATGYPLPHVRPSATPLVAGLRQTHGITLDAWEDADLDAFAAQDLAHPTRQPLADRFAVWVTATQDPALGALARWEAAAITRPPAPHTLAGPPADGRRRLRDDVRLVHAAVDVLAIAERADQGSVSWSGGRVHVHAGGPVEDVPTALLVATEPDGGVLVLDLDPATATALEALADGAVPDLPPDEQAALEDHGVLVPVAWALHAT